MKIPNPFRNLGKGEVKAEIKPERGRIPPRERHNYPNSARPHGYGDDPLFRNSNINSWYGSAHARIIAIRAMCQIANASPVVNSYLQKVVTNVIGHFTPIPNFKKAVPAEQIEQLTDYWNYFAWDPTINGGQNLASVLRALIRDTMVDGRSFCIIRYSDQYENGVGLMPLTRDWLYDTGFQGEESKVSINGVRYVMSNGVLRDEISGRVRFYAFHGKANPQDVVRENEYGSASWVTKMGDGMPIYIPAENVLDFQVPHGIADFDGSVSHILPILATLQKIEDYDQATLKAMKKAAQNMAFLVPELGAPTVQASLDKDSELDYPPENMEDGRIKVTPPGYKIQNWQPASPSSDMTEFRKNLLRAACAALNVDYATAVSDQREVNFSSIRAGIQQSRDHYRVIQTELERRVLQPLLKVLVQTADMRDEVNTRGIDVRKLCMTKFRFRSWEAIDPIKDRKAQRAGLEMGVLSPQEIAESEGKDWDEVQNELDEAVKRAEEGDRNPAWHGA